LLIFEFTDFWIFISRIWSSPQSGVVILFLGRKIFNNSFCKKKEEMEKAMNMIKEEMDKKDREIECWKQQLQEKDVQINNMKRELEKKTGMVRQNYFALGIFNNF